MIGPGSGPTFRPISITAALAVIIVFCSLAAWAQSPGLTQTAPKEPGSGEAVPLDLPKLGGSDQAIADVFKAIKPKKEIVDVLAEEPKPGRPKPEIAIYLLFKINGTELADERSKAQLDEAGSALASPELKNHRFETAGHTDNTGDSKYNQSLSQARAEAVRDYIIKQHKVDAARLTARGYGQTRPLASNDTALGRAQNRRVSFTRLD
ncbi:MAG: OmpA family protein [Thermodesulfobacteriota bacterium]